MTPREKAAAVCAKFYEKQCDACPLRPVCCRPSYMSTYEQWIADLDKLSVEAYAQEIERKDDNGKEKEAANIL